MAKTKNERCPLQSECDRTCDYKFAERSCPYYMANARPGFEIESSESAPAEEQQMLDGTHPAYKDEEGTANE